MPIPININTNLITFTTNIHVLGLLFDCKLQWPPQVAQPIRKVERSIHAFNLIKPNFIQSEMRGSTSLSRIHVSRTAFSRQVSYPERRSPDKIIITIFRLFPLKAPTPPILMYPGSSAIIPIGIIIMSGLYRSGDMHSG